VSLITQVIKQEAITQDFIIALEQKDKGKNVRMNNIGLLTSIIKYNEGKDNTDNVVIPEKILQSPIYQDVLLYKIAEDHRVRVVGIEGKDLVGNMLEALGTLITQSSNIILMVGSTHITALQQGLVERKIHNRVTNLQDKEKTL
jgi:hypothetical protein